MNGRRTGQKDGDFLQELKRLLRRHFAVVWIESEEDWDRLSESGELQTTNATLADSRTLFPYAAVDLLDPVILYEVLALQSRQLGDVSSDVTGTLFAKRYSVLIAGMFAAYTLYDVPISADLSDTRIRLEQGGTMAYLVRSDSQFANPAEPMDAGRKKSPSSEARSGFSAYARRIDEHFSAILDAVSSITHAHNKVLRSLVLHQVHMLYARLQAEAAHPDFRPRGRAALIAADREALSRPENAAFHANFRLAKESPPNRPLLMRRYCCQAYRTSPGGHPHGYCESCPKIVTG